MRRTKTFLGAISILLLSTAVVPSVAATQGCFDADAALVCYGDTVSDSGGGTACPRSGDTYTGMTHVVAYAAGAEVRAWGRSSCGTSDYGTTDEDLVAVALYSDEGNAAVAWYQYSAPWGEQCSTFVASSVPAAPGHHDVGCPAGPPPDAAWGQLLP